jgi:hypothetical protein
MTAKAITRTTAIHIATLKAHEKQLEGGNFLLVSMSMDFPFSCFSGYFGGEASEEETSKTYQQTQDPATQRHMIESFGKGNYR